MARQRTLSSYAAGTDASAVGLAPAYAVAMDGRPSATSPHATRWSQLRRSRSVLPDATGDRPSAHRRSCAAEGAASYDSVGDVPGRIQAAIAAVRAIDLDSLSDEGIKDALRATKPGLDALRAFQVQAMGTLEQRALKAAGPGRESRAVDPVRRFGRDELLLSPSEAKNLGETGRRLKEAPQAQRSMEQGRLRPEHATVITGILRHLDGEARDRVEERLVEAARTLDPVRLGQLGRQLLAEADQEAAMHAEQRRHARRSAKVTLTADGFTAIYAQLSGLDGELAHTVFEAFRRPDAPGEHRSPEQATADALVEIFDAALRSRSAPTQHGERPHVNIIVAKSDLENLTGAGFGMFTGPIPATEVLRLARDAKIAWIAVDPVGVPENVSEGRSVVTSALWRALLVRDGGCRWPGCDAPPSRCDIAHAEVPDRDGGPRVLSNVAMLCRRHHRLVDIGKWTMRIRGPDVIFDPPDGSGKRPLVSSRPAA
jgi:hypothetical protein